MNYDNMPAGREMDMLVAELVIGTDFCRCTTDDQGRSIHGYNWHEGKCLTPQYACWSCRKFALKREYSTDIAAAWKVVEKVLSDRQHDFNLESHSLDRHDVVFTWSTPPGRSFASAETAPLAICIAALKAVS